MALKKTLMAVGAVASIGLAGTSLGVQAVSADTEDSGGPPGIHGLVDKLAEKFNLKEEEVQAVFEEHKEEMQAERQAKLEERLSQAVAEGKLTEEQKANILAKLEELKANRPTLDEVKEGNPEERRQARHEKHDELEQWAEENGIPEEYVHFGPMKHVEHTP